MSITNRLGRPMLAAMFVAGGTDSLRNPEGKADVAATVTDEVHDRAPDLPLPDDAVDMVRLNGAVQVVAGGLLALNRLPRVASLALAGTLVPTTLAAHRFWEIEDEGERATQRIHFLKNLAMLGGLLVSAGDTGGKPSIGWRARRAARHASDDVGHGARRLRDNTADLAGAATGTVTGLASAAALSTKDAAQSTRRAADTTKRSLLRSRRKSAPNLSAASAAVGDAASSAKAKALPAVEGASKETRAKAKELWGAVVPIAERVRDQAGDTADRARKASRDAIDAGSASVKSLAS